MLTWRADFLADYPVDGEAPLLAPQRSFPQATVTPEGVLASVCKFGAYSSGHERRVHAVVALHLS